jgi:hypothetical protein
MYTKYTYTLYTEQFYDTYVVDGCPDNPYKSAVIAEAEVLSQQGKTEQFPIRPNPAPSVIQRPWIDQAAADEWKTYLTQLAIDYGTTVQITITDI